MSQSGTTRASQESRRPPASGEASKRVCLVCWELVRRAPGLEPALGRLLGALGLAAGLVGIGLRTSGRGNRSPVLLGKRGHGLAAGLAAHVVGRLRDLGHRLAMALRHVGYAATGERDR